MATQLQSLIQRNSKETKERYESHTNQIVKALEETNVDEICVKAKLASKEFCIMKTNEELNGTYEQFFKNLRPQQQHKRIKQQNEGSLVTLNHHQSIDDSSPPPISRALQVRRQIEPEIVETKQHRKWKLTKVIASHRGVPRAIAVDPSNRIFASGGLDNVIKTFDLATGKFKINLESHTHAIRGLAFSNRHPYLFSCSEDKQIKCWDLEKNQIVRQYHGHTAGVYCISVHPTLDVIVSGGRDSTCRVWDMRTRQQVHSMIGHKDAVCSLVVQDADPQVITGSEDSTVRLWDLAAGKTVATLTHHKKGVRGVACHPSEFAFCSASTGSIKKFALPQGRLLQNFEWEKDGPRSVIHSLLCNRLGDLVVAGTDDGNLKFWDWQSGKIFQNLRMKIQPGSLESECGVWAMSFDMTGERLILCMGDKSIQIFKPIDDEFVVI